MWGWTVMWTFYALQCVWMFRLINQNHNMAITLGLYEFQEIREYGDSTCFES